MKPSMLPGAAAAASALTMTGWLLVSCLQPADEIMDKSGTAGKIVFVKERSVSGNRSIAMASNENEFYPGTDLCLLSPIGPGGNLTNLTAQWTRTASNQNDWGAAQDPEVSFDGAKILFSMKKSRSEGWHLYEMDADGNNLVQLTNQTVGADMDPAYIDGNHIVFASSRNQILDEYERRPVPQLFTGERGGPDGLLKNIRQITFNQSHDQNPFVHSSGKIYFSRWDHLGDPNKLPLFSINPDGTGQFVLFGADETFAGGTGMGSGSRTFLEARELGDQGIVSSIMERASDFEGGAICIIDLGKPITAPPQIITPATSPYNTTQKVSEALFKTPYPIVDNGKERILMAQSPREAGRNIDGSVNYDLFVMDMDGKNLKLIHADANTNDYDPVVIAPRSLKHVPYKVDSNVAAALEKGEKTGMFFDADVYSRMGNDPNRSSDGQMKPKPGQARFLRVLQAVSMPSAGGMRGGNVGHTEFEKQRVMGYADIRGDGSFSIEVPANTPLHVQTLDSNAMMLVNQLQWINVMPGERRVCTGCHGARERDADIKRFSINTDNTVAFNMGDVKTFLSGFNNAQKVTEHPSARADTVDFHILKGTARTNTVQAVLDRRCNSCHGLAAAKDSGGGLVLADQPDTAANNDGLSSVYETLTRENGYASGLSFVNSDGARRSPLAWVMYHRQLDDGTTKFLNSSYDHSQLWSKDGAGRPDPFDARNADLLTLIEWMDMGIQFSNTVGKSN
jgi:hypothetical protein